MTKKNIILILVAIITLLLLFLLPRYTKYHLPITVKPKLQKALQENKRITNTAKTVKQFCINKNYSTQFCFIIDMQQHGGLKRFFVYDFIKDTTIATGLVAHGSCNTYYLEKAKFNNKIGCGCSALGMYKISYAYAGRFGTAYKLIGLDTSNNNAFERNIVLHAYDCVPNNETYPQPICNSLGCPMVSYTFLDTLTTYIHKSKMPIVLHIIN